MYLQMIGLLIFSSLSTLTSRCSDNDSWRNLNSFTCNDISNIIRDSPHLNCMNFYDITRPNIHNKIELTLELVNMCKLTCNSCDGSQINIRNDELTTQYSTFDSSYWGNNSKYVRAYTIEVPNSSNNDQIYATQILSNYNVQCSSFYTKQYNNKMQFVLLAYFNDFNDSKAEHKMNNNFCNVNFPFVFLYKNATKGDSFEMLFPHLQVDEDEMTSTVYQNFMNNEYLIGSIETLQKRVGTEENPLRYSPGNFYSNCENRKLSFNEIYGIDSHSCDYFDSLSLPDDSKTELCNANLYNNSNPMLEEVLPIYYEGATHFYDVCPMMCSSVVGKCSPQPPPPSPPPPITAMSFDCNNTYEFNVGWNSFAFVGTASPENFANSYNLPNDTIIQSYSSITQLDNSISNGFFIYLTNPSTLQYTCTTEFVDCEQTIQLFEGENKFGLRGTNEVLLSDFRYQTHPPSEGDVIETNDVHNYDFFVYSNNQWQNMTLSAKKLKPFVGYKYYTQTANTVTLDICKQSVTQNSATSGRSLVRHH